MSSINEEALEGLNFSPERVEIIRRFGPEKFSEKLNAFADLAERRNSPIAKKVRKEAKIIAQLAT